MRTIVKLGHARVSSNSQDHAAQVEALKAAGCDRIFSEKASGKSTSGRPEFARLMKGLNEGDVVFVVKLDRLARSSRDLQNILHEPRGEGLLLCIAG
jgi:DNA invertase Pin-like site-specific DNA recombinase